MGKICRYARIDGKEALEFLTHDNAHLGDGGHPQFTTPKVLHIVEVFDLELGRALDVAEWP